MGGRPPGVDVPRHVEARSTRAIGPDERPAQEFTYRVLSEAERAVASGERRTSERQRTRLRSGKVLDRDGRFVTECLIYNRSASGSQLRLPGPLALPNAILVYDDQADGLLQATVVWRKSRDIGVRFTPLSGNVGRYRAIAESMRRRFYSVRG